MKPEISKLSNGLRVVTQPMAGAQSASIAVFVGVGSRYENPKKNGGVSHFLEHLLFKGTKNRPSTKIISEQIDAVGGFNNAYTSNELTNYYVKLPYQHVPLGLEILADMIRNSLLDEVEINRERDVIIEEMNVYRDDPARFVHTLTPKLLWPGHELAAEVIGTPEIIKNMPREDIANHLNHHYQPENIVVSAAGKVKHGEIMKLAEKLFGDMVGIKKDDFNPVNNQLAEDLTNVVKKDTAQAHISISTLAYPYLHKNDPAAKVATTILGRGLSSRLFLNVRERKGLAYSVSAWMDNFVDTGDFTVYAGVNIPKQSDAIAAILEELGKISTEAVDAKELDKAKNQVRGSMQMMMEANISVADRYGTQLTVLDKIISIEDTLEKIDAVTAEDVTRVSAEMLDPKRLRMGIISPEPEAAVEKFESLVN